MAIVKGFMQITGSIKGVSFYTRRGSDKVIMRTKGGATKDQIAQSPKFDKTRKQQKEFKGCSKFSSLSRYAFGGLHRLADYNLTPVLVKVGSSLKKLDTSSEIGKRSLKLSENKQALEGFNFNRNYPFNTVLRILPRWELDREQLKADITFPRINTEIDLLNIQKLPFFRLIIAIGTISDMAYNTIINEYEPIVYNLHGHSNTLTGNWNSTQSIIPGQTMTIQMTDEEILSLTDNVSVLVSIAIEFGNIGNASEPVEVKYAGCGKVIGVC